MLPANLQAEATDVGEAILAYLLRCRETRPGEYYGSFWSEKGYHGPLLDWHAGGSHHHRAAGSGGLGLWLVGRARDDGEMLRSAELAFDWLVARQSPRGGWTEIQNNEQPADWERTGLEELSTIATGFAVHGLGHALLAGLAPKKSYHDSLLAAGLWQLSGEWPPGSGVFPHHERSPYNTLNAALHAAETLAVAHAALSRVYDRPLNIFLQGARRAVGQALACQWPDGCLPYRQEGGATINYTSLVLWCLRNLLDALPATEQAVVFAATLQPRVEAACAYLAGCVADDGTLLWQGHETSTARHNLWCYLITANVLLRCGGPAHAAPAAAILRQVLGRRTASGLLPMRDEGEPITECAFMQADMLLFLLPLTGLG